MNMVYPSSGGMGFLKRVAHRIVDEPPRPLEDCHPVSFSESRIPQVVYQTWETRLVGRRHWRSIQDFRRLNSEFNFVLLDASSRDSFMREFWGDHPITEVYLRSLYGPLRADIFRYCILFTKGGYYFDISKGLSVPICSLQQSDNEFFLSQEQNSLSKDIADFARFGMEQKKIIQWGLGFEAGHPILDKIINQIVATFPHYVGRSFPSPKEAILKFTGPDAFSKAVGEYLENSPYLAGKILPTDFCGSGIFSLKGSGYRYVSHPSYSGDSNAPILI